MSLTELVSVDLALDRFLQSEIAIPTTSRSSASTSQNYLRGVLRNKANSDPFFPEILSRANSDFLGGSFQRHTKIWPLDDIDLFLPLDGGNLIYTSGGYRLPFTLATDAGVSRLNQPRWKTGDYIDSTKVLNGLKNALQDTYPSSEVRIDRHCVNLQTTVAATAESEGIGFDVVPCFLLNPDNGAEAFYLVPNANGGWMRSNPRKDANLCAELHEYHGTTYRKAVRLTKYWNRTQLNDAFSSYYIELALSKRFSELKTQAKKLSYTTQAFAVAMETLRTAYNAGNLAPLIAEAPFVEVPLLNVNQKAWLTADAGNATTAFTEAYTNGNIDGAYGSLNAIFNTVVFA